MGSAGGNEDLTAYESRIQYIRQEEKSADKLIINGVTYVRKEDAANIVDLESYLKEVEERAEKATKGPWFCESYKNDRGEHSYYYIHENRTGDGGDLVADTFVGVSSIDSDKPEEKENAEFISHSRTDVPLLLEIVRIQNEALKDVKQFLTWLGYDSLHIGDQYKKAAQSKWHDTNSALQTINALIEKEVK